MTASRSSALVAILMVLSSADAFVQTQNSRPATAWLPASLSSNSNYPSDEAIRRDIEVMREEARERLESLSAQMEDILQKQHLDLHKPEAKSSFPDASSFERVEVPLTTSKTIDHSPKKHVVEVKDIPSTTLTKEKAAVQHPTPAPPRHICDSSLLYDTRWKVVLQVGGTRSNDAALLAAEGEKPLLVHLEVDFSPDLLAETDELLQGSAGRLLVVKEAWIGASSWTEGRQKPVRIKPTGGWKVLPGQGPKGIDILRFYIDVEEEICHSSTFSTLRCPATRVYCTSGFFSMEHHNEAEIFKNHLRDELGHLVNSYEDLTLENERDERLFSFDSLKRAKKMMDLRQEIKTMNQKITQARIRDPEKAMLRLSRKGDMGLTKEGQVCYKDDSQGTASEYLVLGKMEMASINKPIVEHSTDSSNLRP
jgi:hypothetical protein